jgi:hypothetical protein
MKSVEPGHVFVGAGLVWYDSKEPETGAVMPTVGSRALEDMFG